MGRYLLPALGASLAALAFLTHAHGQTNADEGGSGPRSKLRILAVSSPPLAEEQLPEGGVALALVKASLGGTGADLESSVRWTTEALSPQLLSDPSVDLSLPVESADCDNPNNLTHVSAALCDASVFSDPILQVVIGLFTLTNSSF